MTLKWRAFVNQNTWKTEYNLGENEFDMYDQKHYENVYLKLYESMRKRPNSSEKLANDMVSFHTKVNTNYE